MPAKILIAAALLIVLSPIVTGCGDDDSGFKPEDPFREVTSPENLIYNMALCFSERNYDKFVPLIADGFVFVFDEDDVLQFPDYIPPSGVWGKSEFLCAVGNMFDPDYVPEHPDDKVDAMMMELGLSGTPAPSSVQGVPSGTLEGYVTVDFRIETVGDITYLVNSRPKFYFVPDSTATPVTWRLWQVQDYPFEPLSSVAPRQAALADRRGGAPSGEPSPYAKGPTCLGAEFEQSSWGAIMSVYAYGCD